MIEMPMFSPPDPRPARSRSGFFVLGTGGDRHLAVQRAGSSRNFCPCHAPFQMIMNRDGIESIAMALKKMFDETARDMK
ncbi:hypothetical protein BGC31_00915 [Komagataeibacter xylinus]|nr:hypothetical protein BGC31_00915 [Komagataeibacter xylinus]RFP03233.1 hypothetical protein BFX83_10450 [Komagataeibacter xylinus]